MARRERRARPTGLLTTNEKKLRLILQEATPRAWIREREEQRQLRHQCEKPKVQKQVWCLRCPVSDLENKLKVQRQVEDTPPAWIRELEEQRQLRRQCENLRVNLTDAQFEKEIANIRITEPENEVHEEDLERKNVEDDQNCVINELCVRFRKSNKNRTEDVAA